MVGNVREWNGLVYGPDRIPRPVSKMCIRACMLMCMYAYVYVCLCVHWLVYVPDRIPRPVSKMCIRACMLMRALACVWARQDPYTCK